MSIETLFENLWNQYARVNVQADEIQSLLKSKGENVVNDHIALRTFNLPKVNIDKLAEHFIKLGYEEKGDYVFEEKKLYAKHYEHSDPSAPLVFISELKVEEFSPFLQETVKTLDGGLLLYRSNLFECLSAARRRASAPKRKARVSAGLSE